ncbi:LuxR C-terminal-related transcriptional regulator [Amycolatopsis sp. Hca4]|uniref:helix-turn-helix transcriptional regulator n=1 Tax=unclassified Amycolatopsis TaxID=2618356 RepID=UPI001591F0D7|nr:LuxR C-terminal-related transcriptional regulator [Amycolatopsis sp. Hca4]QKV73738.1 response regulator transcription factor [Amycolatopsis sp. Hca4]
MGEKITVWTEADDPVISFGVTAQLGQSAELTLVDRDAITPETVVVLAVDAIDDRIVHRARELGHAGCSRFILVTPALDDDQLRAAVEIGICAVIERRHATPRRLEQLVVKATRGESELPTTLLNLLFRQVSAHERDRVPPRTLPFAGLTTRETQVLRLVADGLDTDEIAARLAYSSRTVKNVLHAVTTRFCLRNRSHAVAYAMREGLI